MSMWNPVTAFKTTIILWISSVSPETFHIDLAEWSSQSVADKLPSPSRKSLCTARPLKYQLLLVRRTMPIIEFGLTRFGTNTS